MNTPFPDRLFLELESCGSTNQEAMRLALSGEAGPLWVRAQRQDEGRGRSGRQWESEPGNLFASLFVRLAGPLQHVGQLSLVAGVAVADAIGVVARDKANQSDLDDFWLKWPNDVMFGEAKCGGLLVETSVRAQGREILAVIGVGLNISRAPSLGERQTTCLLEQGLDISAAEMLRVLDMTMIERLAQWEQGASFAEIRRAWLAYGGELGRLISVHDGSTVIKGRFAGLGDEGYLLVRVGKGDLREVAWGDVIAS